jgi:hypothetical protein
MQPLARCINHARPFEEPQRSVQRRTSRTAHDMARLQTSRPTYRARSFVREAPRQNVAAALGCNPSGHVNPLIPTP